MNMRKITAVFLSLLFMVICLPLGAFTVSAETTSGTTGDCTWTLDGTHLTISGSGAMEDYPYAPAPWGTSIQSVVIKKGVTAIGNYAFYGCKSLTSITIPDNVISINENAFNNCTALSSVSIGDSVTTIGKGAFSGCDSLTSITIPDNVISIGDHAFSYCDFLTSITLGNSVTSIGESAFYYCEALVSVTIPNSVTFIGNEAFIGTKCYNNTANWEKDVLYINKHLISAKTSLSGHYTIEEGTLTVSANAFESCHNLTSVTIPDSVNAINKNAFASCLNLTSIAIGNGVTEIGNAAFESCKNLSSIIIPGNVTTIGSCAFFRCDALTSITIEEGVLTVGDNVFNDCDSLQSVVFPNSVTFIGEQAFLGCDNLTSITLPDNITSIKNSCFEGCAKLMSATVPEGVTTIEFGAFENCAGLTSITLPNSLMTIGGQAFWNCSSLDDVCYNGSESDRDNITIGGANTYLYAATWHYNQGGSAPSNPTTSTTPSTQPTIPSTTQPTTPSNPSGYVINVYSEIPSLVVGTNKTIGGVVQVEKDGVAVSSADQFTFAVSDTGKMMVTDIRKDNDLQAVRFTMRGLSAGTVTMTIQEATTGALYTTIVTITDGVQTYNADALPEHRYLSDIYNGHINGIYIDSFSTKQKDANTMLVSFDAYNESMISGVVDVYDANGVLQATHVLPRHEGNTVSSYSDLIKQSYYIAKVIHGGITEGSACSYRQPFYSQHTPIRDIEVPVGGYIDITNNIMYSDTCALVNACELAVNTFLTVGSSLEGLVNKTDVTNKVTRTLFDQANIKDLQEIGKTVKKELLTPLVKASETHAIADSLSLLYNGTLSSIDFGDINLKSLIINALWESGIGSVESILLEVMSSVGGTIKGLFLAVDYAELYAYLLRMCIPYSQNALRIYFNDANGCLTANGVSISAEDGSSLAAKNFVMHSVVVTPDNGLNNAMKSALDGLSDKYVVRDIYLEKDGKVTQPGQTVRVSVPIPADYDPESCHIYWVQENGTLIELNAVVEGNYLQFETNHFSYYAIVEIPTSSNTFLWVCVILIAVVLIFVMVAIIVLLNQKPRKTK